MGIDPLQQATQLAAWLLPRLQPHPHTPQTPDWAHLAQTLKQAPEWAQPLAQAMLASIETPLAPRLVATPPSELTSERLTLWAQELESLCGAPLANCYVCVGLWLQVGQHLRLQTAQTTTDPSAPPRRNRNALAWWGPLLRQMGVRPGHGAHRVWFFRVFFSYAMLFAAFVSALMGFLFGFIFGATVGYFFRVDMFGCIYFFSILCTLIGIILGISAFREDLRQHDN